MSDFDVKTTPIVKKQNVQFRSNPTTTTEKQVALKKENNKWTVGIGLTAAAAVGVYLLTRGKINSATSVAKPLPENLSHLDIDLFKQYGKFNKGEAIFNEKPFTGTIYTKNDCEMTYINGVLRDAKGNNGTKHYDNAKLSTIVHYNFLPGAPKYTNVSRFPDGTRIISKRILDCSFNGEIHLLPDSHNIVTTIKSDGSVTRVTGGVRRLAKEMNGVFICDKIENLTTGEVKFVKKGFEPLKFGNGFRLQKIVDGKKVTEQFNSTGELHRTWTTEFNPETQVSIQTIKRPIGRIESIIQRDKNGYVLAYDPEGSPGNRGCGPSYRLWSVNPTESKLSQYSLRNQFERGVNKEEMKKYILENDLPFQI